MNIKLFIIIAALCITLPIIHAWYDAEVVFDCEGGFEDLEKLIIAKNGHMYNGGFMPNMDMDSREHFLNLAIEKEAELDEHSCFD